MFNVGRRKLAGRRTLKISESTAHVSEFENHGQSDLAAADTDFLFVEKPFGRERIQSVSSIWILKAVGGSDDIQGRWSTTTLA